MRSRYVDVCEGVCGVIIWYHFDIQNFGNSFLVYIKCICIIIYNYSFVLFPVIHTFMTFFDQIIDENGTAWQIMQYLYIGYRAYIYLDKYAYFPSMCPSFPNVYQ